MKALSKIFDFLGKLLAFIWMIGFILWITNANWGYLDSIPIMVKILNGFQVYGALVLAGVVGFEAAAKKLWLLIPFLILFALCLIFALPFFDGAKEAILGIF